MSAESADRRGFVGRHRGAFLAFALAAALAFAWAVYVFLWFAAGAQSSGMVPLTLGLWTTGELFAFALHAAFWELLLVGVPAAVLAAAGLRWLKGLPDGRAGLGGGSRSSGIGGGASLLLFLAFCTKVYLDGKWNVAIGAFTVDYVVGSIVTILVWGLILLGIPAVVALAWWLGKGAKAW
jgi:hypothetical protein